MDLSTQIVPAVVVLLANLLSGRHGSSRWETVTALFGWLGAVSLAVLIGVSIFARDAAIRDYLVQICGFSLLTAITRDYEKLLRPFFSWNR